MTPAVDAVFRQRILAAAVRSESSLAEIEIEEGLLPRFKLVRVVRCEEVRRSEVQRRTLHLLWRNREQARFPVVDRGKPDSRVVSALLRENVRNVLV